MVIKEIDFYEAMIELMKGNKVFCFDNGPSNLRFDKNNCQFLWHDDIMYYEDWVDTKFYIYEKIPLTIKEAEAKLKELTGEKYMISDSKDK